METLEEHLKQQARDQGFDRVGIAPAVPADGFEHLRAWLDEGYAGEMQYMHRHAEARRHPSSICPPVRSVVMAALQYESTEPSSEASAPRGRVARYARGRDYHLILRERLKRLGAWLQGERPGCWARAVVDTAPLLERDFARRAGLGWFGKNTMLLNRRLGSWFVLGGLLTDVELAADPPFTSRHCGTCTACLDACPTQAFVKPYVLDSRRCISYLTIELRGSIPEELRSGLGNWVFGCDICQEVCPWNRHAPSASHFVTDPDLSSLDPATLLELTPEEFARRFHDTPFLRPGRGGLLRNAALVLGNTAGPEVLPALERACADSDPLVREAAGWAIEQIQRRGKCSEGMRDEG